MPDSATETRRRTSFVDALRGDLRHALRGLRARPGFTIVAALTLALAIGANTAVFTVVNGVLLRPLPFAGADRLMVVSYWPTFTKGWIGAPAMLGRDFVTFQRENRSFDRVALIIPHGAQLTGTHGAATLPGAQVSADFFAVLGAKPAIGRTFARDEGTSTGSGVVVIGHRLWQERFASDSGVVGRTIVLDGQPQTIIGVMPDGFDFPKLPAQAPVRGITPFPASEYWQAIAVDPAAMSYPGPVIGRLRPGVAREQAQAELASMATALFVVFRQHQPWCCALPPRLKQNTTPEVLPLRELYLTPPSLSPEESRDARKPLLFFAAAVALVLVIACSNVAALILMRTMSRTHDIAIRAALGASRRRLVQYSLIESLCLSLGGALAGMPLAWLGLGVLLRLAPAGAIPLADQVRVDGRVLALSIAMVILCGLLAGLAPAIYASRQSPQGMLGRGSRMSQRHPVLEAATVVSIAFALMLLTGGGLLVESFLRLEAVRLGFDPGGVVVMRILPPSEAYRSPAAIRSFRDGVLSELARLPKTVAVAAGDRYLLGASPGFVVSVLVDGRTDPEPNVIWSWITPDYFSVLRTPLVAGRAFTAGDDAGAPRVGIVSRSFAARVWPRQSPIGKRVWMDALDFPPKRKPDGGDWVTVVGIVDDAIQGSIRKPPPAMVYYPLNQLNNVFWAPRDLEVSVRTSGNAATAMRAMRRVMHEIAPDMPIEVLSPLESLVGTERLQPLFEARLIVAFSVLALLLAAVGTYSTLAYSVAQRRRELAIRLALGAQPANVVGLVVRHGALLALAGVGVGIVGSLTLTRALQSTLYETSATDARIFGATGAIIIIAAILACVIPARRATQVDPVVELRGS
jgi:putative ABC transport system permease protein